MRISVHRLLDDNYKSLNAAKGMLEALEREDSGVLLLLSGNWEQGRPIIETAARVFEQEFKVARGNVTIPGEQGHITAIKSKYKAYCGNQE